MRPVHLLAGVVGVGLVAAGLLLWRGDADGDPARDAARPPAVLALPEPVPLVATDGASPRLAGSPVPAREGPPSPAAATATGRVLTGTVVDPEAKGIPGAEVVVRDAAPPAASMASMIWAELEAVAPTSPPSAPALRATTDGAGRFRLEGVPPGPAHLEATARGHQRTGRLVEADATTDVTIAMPTVEEIEGIVVEPSGTAVPGAVVRAVGVSWGVRGGEQTTSDAEGRFQVPRPEGSVVLVVRAEGRPAALVPVPEGERTVRVVLAAGTTLRAQVLAVDAGGAETPLAGARVAVVVSDAGGPESGSVAWGLTDERGEAALSVLSGTLSGVAILHPDHADALAIQYSQEGGGHSIVGGGPSLYPADRRVGPGETRMTFRVAAGLRVVGRVTTEDGAPVAGAVVDAYPGERRVETRTDADGRYEMSVPLGPGWDRVDVGVVAEGLAQPPDSTVIVRPEPFVSPVVHDVVLRREAVVEGRVVAEEGRPVSGAIVVVLPAGEAPPPFDSAQLAPDLDLPVTDAEGRFRIDGVWAGDDLRVAAWTKGFVPTASAPFDVEPGGTVRIGVVTLLRGTRLRVRILGESGSPLAESVLTVRRQGDAGWEPFTDGDVDGAIETRALRPGTVFVSAESPSSITQHRRLVLDGRVAAVDLEFRLVRGATVAGRVLDASGSPSTDHPRVRVGDRDAWLDEEGRFRIEGVAPGPVVVRVFGSGRAMQVVRLDAPREDVEIVLGAPVPDAAARQRDLERRRADVEAERSRTTDPEEHARLVEEAEDLRFESQSLVPPPAPPAPAPGACGACGGGTACG